MAESNATQVILTDDGIKIIKAQSAADNATSGVANLNDPNFMSVIEKQTQATQYAGLTSQYNVILSRAKDANVSTADLTTAYTNLNTFMAAILTDTTKASDVDRKTYKSLTDAYNMALSNVQVALSNSFNTDIDNMQSSVSVASQAASSAAIVASQAAITGDNASHEATQAAIAASQAQIAGNNANSVANNASQAASSAVIAGSQATSVANQAFSQAQSAVDYANSEIAIQSTAIGKAQSAASDAVEQASSAATDSKDAKQIAGAVSQSYKTLTDGSTMTIAELQSGLAVKLTKTDLDGYATQTWAQNQINTTADGINGTISSIKSTVDGQTTSINDLKADSKSFKTQFTTVNDTLSTQSTDISTLQASSKSLSANFDSLSSDNQTNQHNISQLQASAKEFNSTLTTVQQQVTDSAVGTNLAYGTNQEYSMGYGITATTWKDGYAYEKLPTTIINGEILPQTPHTFYYTLIQGTTYTQTIWFETDATVKNLSAAQITWFTGAGHDIQPARVQKLGQNSYKVVSTYTWPGKTDNNVRLFDIKHLDSTFDLSTGTYLKFGKLKLEKGSLSTDWCLNTADTATQSQITQLSHDINLRVTEKGLIDQINLQAGNTLISSSGQLTLSGKNVFLDSVNPVIMKSANIADLAVGTAQMVASRILCK